MNQFGSLFRFLVISLFVSSMYADETVWSVEDCIELLESRSQDGLVRKAGFTELRYFPFRSKPSELTGVARIGQDDAVSIHYPDKDVVMIIDDAGLLLRKFRKDSTWRDRELGDRGSEAALLIAATMRFDRELLLELFDVSIEGDRALWTLSFRPKDEDQKVSEIRLTSDAERVRVIEVSLEEGRRIVVEITEEVTFEAFSSEESERYFRSA